MNKSDVLGIIAILLMVVGGSMVSYHLIINRISSCTANPVIFAADYIANGENYSYIIMRIYRDKNDIVPLKIEEINLNLTQQIKSGFGMETTMPNLTVAPRD